MGIQSPAGRSSSRRREGKWPHRQLLTNSAEMLTVRENITSIRGVASFQELSRLRERHGGLHLLRSAASTMPWRPSSSHYAAMPFATPRIWEMEF